MALNHHRSATKAYAIWWIGKWHSSFQIFIGSSSCVLPQPEQELTAVRPLTHSRTLSGRSTPFILTVCRGLPQLLFKNFSLKRFCKDDNVTTSTTKTAKIKKVISAASHQTVNVLISNRVPFARFIELFVASRNFFSIRRIFGAHLGRPYWNFTRVFDTKNWSP